MKLAAPISPIVSAYHTELAKSAVRLWREGLQGIDEWIDGWTDGKGGRKGRVPLYLLPADVKISVSRIKRGINATSRL